MLNQRDYLTSKIVAKRAERSAGQAVLVGISGMDAGGKGFITEKIAQRLQESGWRVATINADDWLNLPEVCLSRHKPAEHFYNRMEEMRSAREAIQVLAAELRPRAPGPARIWGTRSMRDLRR